MAKKQGRRNKRRHHTALAPRPVIQGEPVPQIQNFTPTTVEAQRIQIARQVSFSQYSGPLPPPDFLQAIDDACPGGADRVIGQMEEQGRHRRDMEGIVIRGDDRRENRGQVFGFILCLSVVIGGIVLLALGISIAGYISLVAGLGLPAGLFIYKKREAKAQLKEKRDQLQRQQPSRAAGSASRRRQN